MKSFEESTNNNSEESKFNEDLMIVQGDEYREGENTIIPWTLYIYTIPYPEEAKKEETPDVFRVCHLYLYYDILDMSYYVKLFEILRRMKANDIIYLHINSSGGSLFTTLTFINIFSEIESSVIPTIDGLASSAAAILAFVGTGVKIGNHADIMFHNIQTSFIGQSVEDNSKLAASLESVQRIYKNLLTEYCSHILTTEEIKSIIEYGAEIHFTGSELQKRLDGHYMKVSKKKFKK